MTPSPRFQVFATVFAVVFAIVYVIAMQKNYALFTYHPAIYEFGLWTQPPRDGPAMYWYGWLATSALAAGAAGLLACLLPQGLTRRLWPGWSWLVPLGAIAVLGWLLHDFPALTHTLRTVRDAIERKPGGRNSALLICALSFVIATAPLARAGGGINETHEDSVAEDGPSYFGFVRDMHNKPIFDAKVTLKVASGINYVTRSDRSGMYRVRGLGKLVKPEEVVIGCAKDGYQQARVTRRPVPRGKAVKSIETECRMQQK